MADTEEELKSLLMRVKEESEIAGTASDPNTSWQTEGEKVEAGTDFLFLGSKITAESDCRHEIIPAKYFSAFSSCLGCCV